MPPIRRSNLGTRTRNATNQANYRSNRTAQERDDGNERERIRISQTREVRARHSTNNRASLNRAAFSYDVSIDYSNYQCVVIGSMNSVCSHWSDMAVIGIGAENSNDEVTQYQMGRYVSSNEAVWRIFSFPIHERHPSVVHLAVHLENGQRVYFTAQNAVQRAAQPPSTTLTSFF
ncbi:helitron_like_N domain-containing protein [Trichonephila clavata]|uniref:Helitron_like_N domain-containing protein n=1 Tax=Trichonephila clavata TaxID=2740835 RepID=A0A8X6JBR9_TRICU|nr:helitron_like_N domain-containing protein [Trichonephila clavata]